MDGSTATEPEPPPRRAQRPPRAPRSGPPLLERLRHSRVALVGGGILAIFLIWFLVSLFQPFAGSGSGRVVVTIPRGASVSSIADILSREGVISSSFFFEARATIGGDRGSLKPGTYTLRHDMSYSDVLAVLDKGPPLNVANVVIPEGLSRREIARSIPSGDLTGDYIAATKSSPQLSPASYGAHNATDLEGFLFPSTYQVKRGASVDTLVAKQLAAFKQSFASLNLAKARAAGRSPYDVLIIASMIEREAKVAVDRPLVASVIYNRLRLGMPLGIDATTRFEFNDWTQPLTQSQLASPSPYNTRINPGLPPGPIGNPGLTSLRAAADPPTTTFIYYVNDPTKPGYLCFASNAQSFSIDEQRYNEARAGGHPTPGCA